MNKNLTGLFDITYENDYFEVEPLRRGFRANENGQVDFFSDFSATPIYNRFRTREEAEFGNMKRETLYYISELAKELNGGWVYKAGGTYGSLYLDTDDNKFRFACLAYPVYSGIKFFPNITIDQFSERCKPEMLKNLAKIYKA